MKNSVKAIGLISIAFLIVIELMSALRLSFPVMVTTTNVSSELSVVGEGS
jgi:hypothetical protein